MNSKILIKKSKYLSRLLRHEPEHAGLDMADDGWVSVKQLLNNTDLTKDLLNNIVENNNKQRFEFNKNKSRIRARQGHSVKVELGYKEVEPPEFLYHGTAKSNMNMIWKDGLKKMNRHHVHLSLDEDTAYKVGQRHGKAIVLIVAAIQMYNLGKKFYKTENNVWLVEDVPPNFISIKEKEIV